MTIGGYFSVMRRAEEKLDIALWDVGGDSRFDQLSQFYLGGCALILLCINPLSEDFEAELESLWTNADLHERSAGEPGATVPNYLLVALQKDLVTDKTSALAQINIAKFKNKFSQLCADEVLHVSSKEVSSRDIVINTIVANVTAQIPIEKEIIPAQIKDRLDAIKSAMENSYFKHDASRLQSVERLEQALLNAQTTQEKIKALIDEAIFIRTPDENGKLRYGVNLGLERFKFFIQFRSYEESTLYKFIKQELKLLAPEIDLVTASAPPLVDSDIELANVSAPQAVAR
jgi:GTPase SAR1 family protein